jgi:hypothetical protein
MTGRILPFHSSTHATADALLPWYVNGTLRDEELAFVEEHLKGCDQCQGEVDWLRQVFVACAALGTDQDTALAGSRTASGDSGRLPRRAWPARLAQGWRTAQPWMRGLLAAQLAAIAILGTVLLTDSRDEASYRTLGAAQRSNQAHNAFAVMFAPTTTESELQGIVMRTGGRIVDGPTVTNAFVLEVPAALSDQALNVLRADSRVQLAEPLGPRIDR